MAGTPLDQAFGEYETKVSQDKSPKQYDTTFQEYEKNKNILDKKYKVEELQKTLYNDTQFNEPHSQWLIDNYRTTEYTKNPNYLFKKDELYDLIGINNGKGPGKKPDNDSNLTRSNLQNKPYGKLADKSSWYKQRKEFLDIPITSDEIDHDKFLVSTTISDDPQDNFWPSFEVHGINTRHYARKSELYYKKLYK